MDCKKHPIINKIIQQFRLEQKNTEVLYAQLESGDVYHRKQSEVDKRQKIKEILKNYKKQDLLGFLDSLGKLM